MAKDTAITAEEWIEVRRRVVEKIKSAGSRQEPHTLTNHAETLMIAGYIDITYIAQEIRAEKEERERKNAQARATVVAPKGVPEGGPR